MNPRKQLVVIPLFIVLSISTFAQEYKYFVRFEFDKNIRFHSNEAFRDFIRKNRKPIYVTRYYDTELGKKSEYLDRSDTLKSQPFAMQYYEITFYKDFHDDGTPIIDTITYRDGRVVDGKNYFIQKGRMLSWKEVQIVNINTLEVVRRFTFEGENTGVGEFCITENEKYCGFEVTHYGGVGFSDKWNYVNILDLSDFSLILTEKVVPVSAVGMYPVKNAIVWQEYDWRNGLGEPSEESRLTIFDTNTFRRRIFEKALIFNIDGSIIQIDKKPTGMEEGRHYQISDETIKYDVEKGEIIEEE